MAKYEKLYTSYMFPNISDDQILSFNSGNYVVTGVMNFSKPFELRVNYSNLNSNSRNCIRSLSTTSFSTVDGYLGLGMDGNSTMKFWLGSFAQISIPFDNSKSIDFVINWDGSTYTVYGEYLDGTKTTISTYNSTNYIRNCRLAIGFDGSTGLSDLKRFSFKYLGSSFEIKLVQELKEIVKPNTIGAKLDYLNDTTNIIKQLLIKTGIDIEDPNNLREYCNTLRVQGMIASPRWEITDGRAIAKKFPIFLKDFSDSSRSISFTSQFELNNMRFTDDSMSEKFDNTTYTPASSNKRRNSIFTISRWYQQGSSKTYIAWENPDNRYYSESVGYFVTGDDGGIVKHIDSYDSKYEYKPELYPENFLEYNPSDKSMTVKQGQYLSCNTKSATEATINVEEDKVLPFDERMASSGYLTWRDANYEYSFQISPPQNRISISTYNASLPSVPDYIRSRKMKTTSSNTSYITLYNTSNSGYQYFTNDFVDFSTNIQNSQSLYFRYNSSSNFSFHNVGDQYIIRTEVGDGFRNYPSADYIYKGYYLNSPTTLTHTRQLTMLDGSTRLIDDGVNRHITLEELRNIDYIDDIYTVDSTDRYTYNRSMSISDLVTGSYQGAYSYGIRFDTSYDSLSMSKTVTESPVNLYINVKAGNDPEDITNTPRYPMF